MKVLIADDHRLIVEGVKTKLCDLDPDVETVTATTTDELRDAVDAHADSLDLALVDLGMPGGEGHRHVAELRDRAPGLPVIVLSGLEDGGLIRELIDLGVQGYIPKAYSPDVMLSAIRLVLSGGVYIPPMLLANAQSQGWRPALPPVAGKPAGQDAAPVQLDALRSLLTERQIDVVRLLSQGKPNKVIARELKISEGTVKIHLAAIFRALNARNRVEAVVMSRNLRGL